MNEEISRRRFLRRLTVLGAGAALLPLTRADAAPTRWLPIGKVADYKANGFRVVTLPGGAPVEVRRLPGHAPKFLALSARCTHKGCTVAWIPADHQFRCPCHGGRFDAAGRNIAGPPPSPLPALPTRVVRGVVQVAVYDAPAPG